METRKFPIIDDHGKVIAIGGISRDITESKKAQEALRESEKLYKALVETTNTGYVVVSDSGKVMAANQEYLRLTGHETVEQVLGRSVIEWTAKHDHERNAAEIEKCFKEGQARNLEIDYVDKAGCLVPIEINATVVGKGESRRIMTLCRDISDRKKSEGLLVAQKDLGLALSTTSNLNQAFELCIDTARRMSGMEAAWIYLVNDDSSLDLVVYSGPSDDFLVEVKHLPKELPETQIFQRIPVYFSSNSPGSLSLFIPPALLREGCRASALVPITHHGRAICSLHLCSNKFDEVPAETRTALEAISSQLGTALARIRAEEAAAASKEALEESERRYREVVDLE